MVPILNYSRAEKRPAGTYGAMRCRQDERARLSFPCARIKSLEAYPSRVFSGAAAVPYQRRHRLDRREDRARLKRGADDGISR